MKEKPQCFVCLADRSLDDPVEGTQVKTTKYVTKYAVHVFQYTKVHESNTELYATDCKCMDDPLLCFS